MIGRRKFLASIAALAAAPRLAHAGRITDGAGRSVSLNAPARRIFPAGPPAAIMLYTLAPDALIGWTRANRPEECAYLLPEICARPELGRITGRGNSANLEVVLAAQPDLVLDVGSTSQTFVSLAERVEEQTRIPYALLDGRFTAIPESYRKLGELIGREAASDKLARYAQDTLDLVHTRVSSIPPDRRPKVYYARGPRGLATGLGGSINVETIEMVARNVAGETQGGLANVSIEQVLAWNPDMIITIDREFADNVRSDPAWAPVKAVREGRIHLSPKMPFGWIDFPPSVNRLIGLRWLGQILYPDKFTEDLRALTREFYTLFYHMTPSDAQIDHVLAGRD